MAATSAAKPLLDIKTPVPSDIDIAQSIAPVHIGAIATALGLTSDEYDLYGKYKAKVQCDHGRALQSCYVIV
jgi:formyltetrahydrofolate synthetase